MSRELHEQRGKFACAFCMERPGLMGMGEHIHLCIPCRTSELHRVKTTVTEIPQDRQLEPYELVARDLMLSASRSA